MAERIGRPVLFGEQGAERVAFEIDAVHDELGVLVEAQAGSALAGMPSTETSFDRHSSPALATWRWA